MLIRSPVMLIRSPVMLIRSPVMLIRSPVILSEAKDLSIHEILRDAQNDEKKGSF